MICFVLTPLLSPHQIQIWGPIVHRLFMAFMTVIEWTRQIMEKGMSGCTRVRVPRV